MDWSADGIILGIRRHGESNAIVELLTEERGRHAGLVRGGRSRRMQAALQPGNTVRAVWRARLEDHLGTYAVEPLVQRAAGLMATGAGLAALNTLTAHCLLLAEREPHPRLFRLMDTLLAAIADDPEAAVAVIRFELALMDELGFGLDLKQCAATGTRDDLVYVSPKTGRAVSRAAGSPYHDRMLRLPGRLSPAEEGEWGAADIRDGFALTEFFLNRHIYGPRGIAMPVGREKLVAALVVPR
ncbi:MAG: DNA repair protein RecO [Rhodobiaceae bacterium]|nr:DNA repair protein RecO [Rhodobiaceae bacterium]